MFGVSATQFDGPDAIEKENKTHADHESCRVGGTEISREYARSQEKVVLKKPSEDSGGFFVQFSGVRSKARIVIVGLSFNFMASEHEAGE